MHSYERRTGARPSAWWRPVAALALSLAVNAGGLVAAVASGALSFLAPGPRPAAVAMAPLSPSAWEANRRHETAARAAAPPRPAEPGAVEVPRPAPPPPAGQVVDVAPSPDPRRPDRARFLAERDGRVERETRSRFTGQRRWETALPKPSAGVKGRAGIGESGEDGQGDESEPGRVGAEADTVASTSAAAPSPAATAAATPVSSTSGMTIPIPDAPVSAARALLARADGDGGLRRAGTWDPRLVPAGARLDAPAAGGPSESVPASVPEGEETRLNTRRFRFAEFYARVQAAIRREWDPNRAWDARDPQDRLLGRRTRNARFDIVVEPDGRLRDVRLVESSGLGFLDQECERAIRAAAPFPNPPAGLVERDGAVVLRGWVLSFDFTPRGALEALRR